MEPQPSSPPDERAAGHDPLMDRLEALLRDYVSRLPSGHPIQTLPALLHAMDAIDALAAAGVARASIAAVAERTLAPLAASRPGAARRVCVPVERVYRAIALANSATGTSPEIRAIRPPPEIHHAPPIRVTEHRPGATPAAVEAGTRATVVPKGREDRASASLPATVATSPHPSGLGSTAAPREMEAQNVLGELRRQRESRRLPPREPFDPFNVETRPTAGGGPEGERE